MTLSETFIAAINQEPLLKRAKVERSSQRTTRKAHISRSERRTLETQERMQALHDALAGLLVREDQSEKVAVGIAFSAQALKIFVASDRNEDLEIMGRQLRNVWSGFQDTKATSCDSPDARKREICRKGMDLRCSIYEYSWNKHMQRYSRYKDSIRSIFVAEISEDKSHVTNEPADPRSGSISDEESKALENLRTVCQIMDKCDFGKMPDRIDLNKLARNIILLDKRAEELGENVLSRWATLYSMTMVEELVDGLCSIERAVRDVDRVLLSSKSSVIFDAHLDVVLVSIQPVLLKYDLLDDPNIHEAIGRGSPESEIFESMWKEGASACQEPWKFDQVVYPHCECALIAYLASSTRADVDCNARPYDFIGVSGPACTGCWLYLSIYNDLADQYGLPKFRISRSHREVYAPWAKPVIADEQLDMLLDSELCAHTRYILTDALTQEEIYRQEYLELKDILKELEEEIESGNMRPLF